MYAAGFSLAKNGGMKQRPPEAEIHPAMNCIRHTVSNVIRHYYAMSVDFWA